MADQGVHGRRAPLESWSRRRHKLKNLRIERRYSNGRLSQPRRLVPRESDRAGGAHVVRTEGGEEAAGY
jgi:hypothetical protein